MVRTIVGLDIGALVHDAGEGSARVDCGIGVTSQEAFAAGVLSDPDIATDHPTRGWVWRAGYRTFSFAADQPEVYSARADKDLRAKRKLDNGEMFFVANVQGIEGVTAAQQLEGWIRQYWLDE